MEIFRNFVAADGATVAYGCRREPSVVADQPPLVLIHGAASNTTRWSEFAEQTALAARHPVVRLDLRGHAGSAYRGFIGLEIWCDDIAALLRRESLRGQSWWAIAWGPTSLFSSPPVIPGTAPGWCWWSPYCARR